MNNFYSTEYNLDGYKYASEIYSSSYEEAEIVANKRNINEEVVGVITDYSKIKIENLDSLLHYSSFLSYIALKSGEMTIDEILGDRGILHELIHLNSGDDDFDCIDNIKRLLPKLLKASNLPYISHDIDLIYKILDQKKACE